MLVNISTKKGIDLLYIICDGDRFFLNRIYVYGTTHNLTGTQFLDQLAGTVHGVDRIVWIKPLLKLCLCVGTHTKLLAGFTDIGSVKSSCFEKHGSHIIRDLGVFATHNTGNTYRLLPVTDHQHGIIKNSFLTIQCHKRLILVRFTYNNLMICQFVQIIRMHWLCILLHYIVRDIYNIIDRTDANGSKTTLHPLR